MANVDGGGEGQGESVSQARSLRLIQSDLIPHPPWRVCVENGLPNVMSSGMCHLRNSVLPLVWIRDAAVESISTALSSVPGPKALVLDKQLSGPLGFVVEVALLKRLGIEAMFELSQEALPAQIDNVAYFIRPSLHAVKLIAEQIQEHQNRNETSMRRKHYLFMVPRRTLLCEVSNGG